MNNTKFVEIKEEEFNNFIKIEETESFYQTTMMGDINTQNGNKVYYLGIKVKGNIACAGMFTTRISLGHQYLYSPRGFICNYEDEKLVKYFTTKLQEFCLKNNYFMLKIDPYISLIERDNNGKVVNGGYDNHKILEYLEELGYKYQNYSEQQKWIYVLPITDEETLLNNFTPHTRNYIRKAERMGVKVRNLKYEELDTFAQLMSVTGARKGFSARTLKYYQQMYKVFKDNVVFKVAELNLDDYIESLNKDLKETNTSIHNLNDTKFNQGKLKDLHEKVANLTKQIKGTSDLRNSAGKMLTLSGSMFMLYGNEIVYLFSGNYEEYMKYNGQYAIQWDMIKYAVQNKYELYNFYGIAPNFNKEDPNYGIYEFKRGFNGHVVETIGELDLPVTKFYKLYKFIKRIKK